MLCLTKLTSLEKQRSNLKIDVPHLNFTRRNEKTDILIFYSSLSYTVYSADINICFDVNTNE